MHRLIDRWSLEEVVTVLFELSKRLNSDFDVLSKFMSIRIIRVLDNLHPAFSSVDLEEVLHTRCKVFIRETLDVFGVES